MYRIDQLIGKSAHNNILEELLHKWQSSISVCALRCVMHAGLAQVHALKCLLQHFVVAHAIVFSNNCVQY